MVLGLWGLSFYPHARPGTEPGVPTPSSGQRVLEFELIHTHVAQRPVLRVEVGARALRVRPVSREEAWASAGVQCAWVSWCGWRACARGGPYSLRSGQLDSKNASRSFQDDQGSTASDPLPRRSTSGAGRVCRFQSLHSTRSFFSFFFLSIQILAHIFFRRGARD